jgi:hypothetical protein
VVRELERLLGELLQEHRRGAVGTELARARSHLDRYMRGLVATGALTERQLLGIVREQRQRVDGPATTALGSSGWELDAEAA